jgi:hypothetical protein
MVSQMKAGGGRECGAEEDTVFGSKEEKVRGDLRKFLMHSFVVLPITTNSDDKIKRW